MPIAELRQILRESVTPFLKGGWHAGEKDVDLYTIHLMDKAGREAILDIPYKDGTIDLTTDTGAKGFSFCLLWDDNTYPTRYWDGRLVKDSSATGGEGGTGKKGMDVADCLDAFASEEKLQPSEAWYCPDCKKHQCATKKFDLWRLPDALVIHLKRFNYNRYFRDKLDTFIDFPVSSLDLSKWVVNAEEQKNCIYDLYAVSNHFGGMGGGHYTAYAKNLVDGRWYNLDDSSVSPVDSERVVTQAAYVLFYHRRTKGSSAPSRAAPITSKR